MNEISFKIINSVEEAKKIWETFSPHKSIDDEWEFRYTFFKYLEIPIHFIVGYDNAKPIGLLPLQLNTLKGLDARLLQMDKPFLEFFGGVDTDDNKVFIAEGYTNSIPQFLNGINTNTVLTSIKDREMCKPFTCEYYLDRFEADLQGLSNFEDFLHKFFAGKSRQNLAHRMRFIQKNFTVEIKKGNSTDLDLLFALSIERFGERSSFNLPYRQAIYKDLANKFPTDIFTINLNGEPKAVSYAIIFNRTYTLLNIGYDYANRDLGKLLVATQIEHAINLGCIVYDAGQGDNGWKERFHLTKIPQYKLIVDKKE